MSALDELLLAIRNIFVGGSPVPLPPTTLKPVGLNFASGATVAYNTSTQQYDVAITPAGGGGGQNPASLSNGLNSNVSYAGLPTVRLSGPSGAFSVGGFSPSSGVPPTGFTLDVINTTDHPMTIVNGDGSSTTTSQINTGTGADVNVPARQTGIRLVYNGSSSKWDLQHAGLIYPFTIGAKERGAKGDGQRVTDGVLASGTTALHSATANFKPSDAGKLITVYGASTTGVSGVLCTTIASYVSATQVTLTASATQSVGSNLSGTVHVVNGSSSITFSTSQTIKAGTTIVFDSQPGVTYTLGVDLSGTGGVLQSLYSGSTAVTAHAVIQGVVRWGTDDYDAIVAAMNAAAELSVSGFCAVAEVYFAPGEYCIRQGISFDTTYNGLHLRGAASGEIGGAETATRSRILLMAPVAIGPSSVVSAVYNVAQHVRVSELWISGNRLATRVIDFEFFAVSQEWYLCKFDGASVTGHTHHYGNDNTQSEIDFVRFHNPYMSGDFFDASYYCGANVYNENGNAFQITYYDGLYKQGLINFDYLRGSCSVLGSPQVFQWSTANIRIQTYCQPCCFERMYNEQDTASFLLQVANFAATSGSTLTLRDCQLNGHTAIKWVHTMRLKLENLIIDANITSDPDAAIGLDGVAYGTQMIVSDNTVFTNSHDWVFFSGSAHQLLDEQDTQIQNLAQTTVSDAAIASNTTLNSASAPFTKQSVGMPVTVADAKGPGIPLNSFIKSYNSATQVVLANSATATVTGKTASFGVTQIQRTRYNSPTEMLAVTGYDANGIYLAPGKAFALAGAIINADYHAIFTLTQNRTYEISSLYVGDFGVRIRVSRVGATDAFAAIINYDAVSPKSVSIVAGQWAEFEYMPSNGWLLTEYGGSSNAQSGTVALGSGVGTVNSGITVTANTVVIPTRVLSGGTITTTVMYTALQADMVVGGPGTGAITIKAVTSAGATNTSDTSTIGYVLLG